MRPDDDVRVLDDLLTRDPSPMPQRLDEVVAVRSSVDTPHGSSRRMLRRRMRQPAAFAPEGSAPAYCTDAWSGEQAMTKMGFSPAQAAPLQRQR
jgi:hypothetical protein